MALNRNRWINALHDVHNCAIEYTYVREQSEAEKTKKKQNKEKNKKEKNKIIKKIQIRKDIKEILMMVGSEVVYVYMYICIYVKTLKRS